MKKKVWFKILIMGALVNLFAASAWADGDACGTATDKKEKIIVTDSNGSSSSSSSSSDDAGTTNR